MIDAKAVARLLALIFPDSRGGAIPLVRVDCKNPRAVGSMLMQRLRTGTVDIGDHVAIVETFREIGREQFEVDLIAIARDASLPLSCRACALCACRIHSALAAGNEATQQGDPELAQAFSFASLLRLLDIIDTPAVGEFVSELLGNCQGTETEPAMANDIEEGRRTMGIPAAVTYAAAIVAPKLARCRQPWLDAIGREGGPGAIHMLGELAIGRRIDVGLKRQIVATIDTIIARFGEHGFVDAPDGLAAFADDGKRAMLRCGVQIRRGVHLSIALDATKKRVRTELVCIRAGTFAIEAPFQAAAQPLSSMINQSYRAFLERHRLGASVDHGAAVALCVMDGAVPPASPDWLPRAVPSRRLHIAR